MIADENVNRIKKLEEHAETPCSCNGLWFHCTKDLLEKNGIEYDLFSHAMCISLKEGRGKHLNLLLHGPADCGNTFLLKPICDILPNVIMDPANSTFGWMGMEKSNLIFLNDLPWAPTYKGGNIDWGDFLNFLEGMDVTLPAPMNTCSPHLPVSKTMPIFATSIERNRRSEPQTERHHVENRMMEPRWKTFKFNQINQIAEEEKVKVEKCRASLC